MTIELRPYADGVEVRKAGESLVLTGTAIRYGARSRDLGGFRERIMPGAATESIQKGDVLALDEHRTDRYLGRTGNGTLRLIDSTTELRYEVDLPDTAIGREVAALAQRGDYRGSSFGFRSLAASWTKDDDGTPLRTITAFKMVRDVGPTVTPAYETGAAEAALRCLPSEVGIDVEVRSVLEAAQQGRLAELLAADGQPPLAVVHRRPASWFV